MTRIVAVIAFIVALALSAAPARAGVANGGLPGDGANPLTGMRWGVYPKGEPLKVYDQLRAAGDPRAALLGRIALRPVTRWYGQWIDQYGRFGVVNTIRSYIQESTGGDPNVMAQLAIFALEPYERQACTRVPTAAEQSAYRTWVDLAADAIGDSRVALILQPDLPFTSCLPHHSRVDMRLVSWAARRFSALPHTTVYLDAAASDWLKPDAAARLLIANGVRSARGFATDLTHYASTTAELSYGHKVIAALARRGVHGKHFVVSTSENGTPFTFQKHPDWFHQGLHVGLGIPPTTDVANARWGLPSAARRIARREVDAYMWIARPWLLNAGPFELDRALRVAAATPKRYL